MRTPERIARVVVVRGLVQGVLFRDACRRQALDAGLEGWVRNEHDGSVRALFEGPPDSVDQLVRWMHDGPRNAIVEEVDVAETDVAGLSGFSVR